MNKSHNSKPNLETDEVPCDLCGRPTRMKGTKRCDRCWELETRIQHNPELARLILSTLPAKKKNKAVPPRSKITDAANGRFEVWTTPKTTPGTYELTLEAPNRPAIRVAKIKVEP